MNLERLTEATVIMLLAFIGGGAVATLNKPTPTPIPTPAPEVGSVEVGAPPDSVPQGASLAPAADPPAAAGVLEPSPAADVSVNTPPASNQSACAACAPAAARYVYQQQPAGPIRRLFGRRR